MALINGFLYDHSSHTLRIDGLIVTDVREFTGTGADVEEGVVYANGAKPQGRTRGQLKPSDLSLKVGLASARALRTQLGPKHMARIFTLSLSAAAEGNPTVSDTYIGCRIKSDKSDTTAGTDDRQVTFAISVLDWKPDGKEVI